MWTIRTWIHFSDRSNPFIFPYFDWFWVSGKFLLEKNTNLKLFTFLDLHKCIKNTLLLKRSGISWNPWDKFMHLRKLVLVKKGNHYSSGHQSAFAFSKCTFHENWLGFVEEMERSYTLVYPTHTKKRFLNIILQINFSPHILRKISHKCTSNYICKSNSWVIQANCFKHGCNKNNTHLCRRHFKKS